MAVLPWSRGDAVELLVEVGETADVLAVDGERLPSGFVLAQGGAVELKFPGKNFFRSIPSNYGPYKHPGAVFANFGAQVGFLCSDCAESDRID